MSLYNALIDFRDNENDPMWIRQEDRDGIIKVLTVNKRERGKSWLSLNFSEEEYTELFIEDNDYTNNKFYISVAFGRGYYGDSVFIDTYYHGTDEMKEGYIFRYFSEDNLKKLESILKITRPKLSIYKENDRDEIGQFLLDNFERETNDICSTYSYEFDAALVTGLRGYVIDKLCKVFLNYGVVEKECASQYLVTVDRLIKIWDNSDSSDEDSLLEMLKNFIKKHNLEIDEDLAEDYYAYYDDANFDQVSFDNAVERELDRIHEKIQEQIESGDLKVNMEIIDFLDDKGYRFDRWYDFPKEKTFGKKDPRKFKFDGIDEGKIKIILSQSIGTKGFWLNLDQLKNFLYHPELFD